MRHFFSTIAAISTPLASGGIAAIRLSGERARELARTVFVPKKNDIMLMKGYTAAFGHFAEDGQFFDEGICLVYRAPNSYTGEDVVELFCHGGVFLAQKILQALLQNGAEAAAPGEFTRRAFENGKMDLTAAESVMNLISASGDTALREAYLAKSGRLYEKILEIERLCIEMTGMITAYIDYPDEGVEPPDGLGGLFEDAISGSAVLLEGYENGKVFRQGVNTVILGRPNTGKSALMNLLAGSERSIVTPVEGTTRDVISETVRLGQFLLAVSDTAGIREGRDIVEQMGVDRAKGLLSSAELVLVVFDGSQPLAEGDCAVMELIRGLPCICVINKADLPLRIETGRLEERFSAVVKLCALDGNGLPELESAVGELLGAVPPEGPVLFNARQKQVLQAALESLQKARRDWLSGQPLDAVAVGIEDGLEKLGGLTGKNIPQSVAEEIFSKFCVGK